MQRAQELPGQLGGDPGKLTEYHLWCRTHSAKDERFYRTLDPNLPGNPLRTKPRLWEAGRPALQAYNFVLTWADGMGGVSHEALEWYLQKGEGAVLTPESKELVRQGVEALVGQDRRLHAEEMEKLREKTAR